MAAYPVWWDTTITVFNQYKDAQTDIVKWYRSVIDNCFWKNVRNEITIGEVTVSGANSILCRIREDSRFKLPYEWMEIPNDKMENYFTLSQGDIIIKGNIDDTIDEYAKGKRSTDIIQKYKAYGCMEIDVIAINTGRGRVNPHYRVEGK